VTISANYSKVGLRIVVWIAVDVMNLDMLIWRPAYAADVLVPVQHFL